MPGTLVAMTPATDMYSTICKVAVVAARPLAKLQQSPPEIDLFFRDASDVELDPQSEWVIVEARNGYFEAYRHVLCGLQRAMSER